LWSAARLSSLSDLKNARSSVTPAPPSRPSFTDDRTATTRKLDSVEYGHLLVAYEGSQRGDETVREADAMARRSGTRLTVVVVVTLERPTRWVARYRVEAVRRRAACPVVQPE
jgi:hypothetical protein